MRIGAQRLTEINERLEDRITRGSRRLERLRKLLSDRAIAAFISGTRPSSRAISIQTQQTTPSTSRSTSGR